MRLGIFARAVPAAQLLADACATARALQGQPRDAATKFAQLAQADVPAHSEATARAVAFRHGISAHDFDHYPAHSAIVDSVLKGAHLPPGDATAVEMAQFLRLMFDPVAGRMVTTLFLERLRAERELTAPAGMRIESLRSGAMSAARSAWVEALARTKLPQTSDVTLPHDTLELTDTQGLRHRVALRVLDDAPEHVAPMPLAVLSPAGPCGRVLEIVAADTAPAAALTALAASLRALPWRTPGCRPACCSACVAQRWQSRRRQPRPALSNRALATAPFWMLPPACPASHRPGAAGR